MFYGNNDTCPNQSSNGNCDASGDEHCCTPYPYNDDFTDEFDFNDIADFDNPLYCFPGSQPQTLEVYSQPPSPSEPGEIEQPNEVKFSSLHSLRGFIETSGLPLDKYVIIMPAKKYRSLRYDKRPSHANKCEFIMAKIE